MRSTRRSIDHDHAEAAVLDAERTTARLAEAGEAALRRTEADVARTVQRERAAAEHIGPPTWGVAWTHPDDCHDATGRLRCLVCHECLYFNEEHREAARTLMSAHVQMCMEADHNDNPPTGMACNCDACMTGADV